MAHEPPQPPVPTGAVQSGPSEITVTFDKPLVDGSLDTSNWAAISGLLAFPATSANAAGGNVIVVAGSSATFNAVNYSPPPFDVVGLNGLAVEAFSLPI